MNLSKSIVAACVVAILSLLPSTAAPAKDKVKDDVESVLSSVSAAELPAKAADLVTDAKKNQQDSVALDVIQYVGSAKAGSIVPVLSAVIGVVPANAASLAAEAAQWVPSQLAAIKQAAIAAAPNYENQITAALGGSGEIDQPGNRPTVPPGLAKDPTKPGSIRGNRPTIPPGLAKSVKLGRDSRRHNYGSP